MTLSTFRRHARVSKVLRLVKKGRRPLGLKYPHRPMGGIKRRLGTKTGTKTKLTQIVENTNGLGGSTSYFSHNQHKIHKTMYQILKDLPLQKYYVNGSSQLTAAAGKQADASVCFEYNNVVLDYIRSQIANVTSGAVTSGVNGGYTTDVFHKSCKAELMMTNQGTGNIRVRIYDVLCRKTTGNDPAYDWHSGMAQVGNLSAGTGANADLLVGMSPFDAPLFTEFWNVKKITEMILIGGQSHCHRIHIGKNEKQSGVVIEDYEDTEDLTYTRGWAHCQMVVAHGLPYNDSTTHTQVSTGQVQLDMVWRQEYGFNLFQTSQRTNNIFVNNLTAFSNSENEVKEAVDAVGTAGFA